MISTVIKEQLINLNTVGDELLTNLKYMPKVVGKYDTKDFYTYLEEQKEISHKFNELILELKSVIESSKYNRLSEIVSMLNDKDINNLYADFKMKNYNIASQTNLNNIMLRDCEKITNTQLNIVLGREDNGDNFTSKDEAKQHMLAQLRIKR